MLAFEFKNLDLITDVISLIEKSSLLVPQSLHLFNPLVEDFSEGQLRSRDLATLASLLLLVGESVDLVADGLDLGV